MVVCPLLSLMQDQVAALVHGKPGGCGVPATFLSSQQSEQEVRAQAAAVRGAGGRQRGAAPGACVVAAGTNVGGRLTWRY